jgi:ribonuclease PH
MAGSAILRYPSKSPTNDFSSFNSLMELSIFSAEIVDRKVLRDLPLPPRTCALLAPCHSPQLAPARAIPVFQRSPSPATGLTSNERIPVLETKNSSMTIVRVRSTFAAMDRIDRRTSDQLRPVAFDLGIAPYASGSVLVTMGNTRVICGVTIEEAVPRWMKEQGVAGGWLTAEYSMLPYSTQTRKPRDIARGRLDGRSVEIQRLIGRSLRAVIDLEKLGPHTVWVDCDVLQADGGTRTTAITGASLALAIACRKLGREKKLDAPPMQKLVAAVSAGILDGQAILDLNYEEDKLATVDFNLVATEDGEFVEVQASGEEATFANSQLDEMLALARKGIAALIGAQRAVLARIMVSPPETG